MSEFAVDFPVYVLACEKEVVQPGLAEYGRFVSMGGEDESGEQLSYLAVFKTDSAARLFIAARTDGPPLFFIVPLADKAAFWRAIDQQEEVEPPLGGVTLDPVFVLVTR